MKSKIIAILKSGASKEDQYRELLAQTSAKLNLHQLRNFQTSYTPDKLEKLIYEAKKAFEISDLDIYNYIHEEINENPEPAGSGIGEGSQDPTETEVLESDPEFIKALKANTEAQEGLKIRDEYPFLNDANCPNEFKILVADKITAWKEFAKNREALDMFTILPDQHEEITEIQQEQIEKFNALSEDEKDEAYYLYAKSAVENFHLNSDIKAELDFYKETGKVLGDHPLLSDLKIKQEIYELDEAGLVGLKIKAQKNESKAKTEIAKQGSNEAREKRVKDWGLRLKLINERLEAEFAKK